MKIVCKVCGVSPFDGFSLFRDKGALFGHGWSLKGARGNPLFCAACAPAKVKRAILASPRVDSETKELADD